MAIALELIDAEIEAFHSNVETGSLDDKSPSDSMSAKAFHEKADPCQGHVVGQVILFSLLRPDSWSVWPARSTVKAERSEFILSLDCGRAGDIKVHPGEIVADELLSGEAAVCASEPFCRHPSIRTLV